MTLRFGGSLLHKNEYLQRDITAQFERAVEKRQRRLVTLSGDREWSKKLVEEYLVDHDFNQSLCISDENLKGIESLHRQQARQLLGRQLDFLVYDFWSGFDPDALAAVVGCLTSGSLLMLLVPPFHQWPNYADPDYKRLLVHPFESHAINGRFVRHFMNSLINSDSSLLIEQGKDPVLKSEPAIEKNFPNYFKDEDCLTADQATAVDAICSVRTGRAHRPLVITADRGRGKSAALGIASARLMQQGDCRIVITASRPEAVAVVFEHALSLIPESDFDSMRLQLPYASLCFIAPDELLRKNKNIDILLVDEAATIPASMLENLLKNYPRIVFVTTVHGYEGTGRGFEIRFKKTLQQYTPQWKAIELKQPIRWEENDPVEQWLFDALLLNAKPVANSELTLMNTGHFIIERLDRDCLLNDQKLLAEIFGLLVCAHYQTKPSDLRILLDGVNVSVWVGRIQGHVIAAALVAEEGGFDESLSLEVWKGNRRPHGHILPQTLAANGGFKRAPLLRYLRIVRVAVHPASQRQSLGTQLISSIAEQGKLDNIDFIGSSFAATADVVSFWSEMNFFPVILGVSRDASSGCHSLLMLSALSDVAKDFLPEVRKRFNQQFPRDLMALHQELDTQLVRLLMLGVDSDNDFGLDDQQWLDVDAFSEHNRQFNHCELSLWKLICLCLSNETFNRRLGLEESTLLIISVLQNRGVNSVIDLLNFSGKKEFQKSMRKSIANVKAILTE